MRVSQFKDPRYTGENRCIACTITNVSISLVITVALTVIQPIFAAMFLVVSLLAIYFRGYLIPGTPSLTKRYFPPWLLSIFGKETESPSHPQNANVQPEEAFQQAGILSEHPSQNLKLDTTVADRYQSSIPSLDSVQEEVIRDILGEGDYDITVHASGRSAILAFQGHILSQWPSVASLQADVASAEVIAEELPGWSQRSPRERAILVRGFRSLVEACPDCGETVKIREDEQESCCSTYEVVTVSCEECGADLLEFEDRGMAEAA